MSTPLPSLGGHELLLFLLQASVLLLVALALGRLAVRLGLPALAGELLTGVVLGPSLLGTIELEPVTWLLPADADQLHLIDSVGQVGVLLLVGVTGAQLDIGMLRRRGTTGLRISLSGLVIPFGLGVAAGYLVPPALIPGDISRGVFALFIGVAMCVTALPVIAKTLADLRLLHRDIGQLILTAGTFDDAVGWFLLSIVAAAATTGVSGGSVALSAAYLVGFLAAALLVGRPLVRWAMHAAGRSADPGPRVAVAVVIVLLGASATHAMKMEAMFGAFVAGILIGQCKRDDEPRTLWQDLGPLRTVTLSVLAPLFLATAGLRMDLTELADPTVLVAALALLAIAVLGKFAGAYLGALGSRLSRWEATALGAGMNSRGVVEVVIASVGLRLGVLTTAAYTIVLLIAVATSLMSPPILRWAMSRVETTTEEHEREAALAAK
ncbi:cation:proton antiporter [Dactylosporangium sp. NPDC005555]|uniref:cation:proton antiporter n=1 Tax=Dactylosporangium sp. NPDC005555 TaxID=3154889 RepID=UPI0033B468BE